MKILHSILKCVINTIISFFPLSDIQRLDSIITSVKFDKRKDSSYRYEDIIKVLNSLYVQLYNFMYEELDKLKDQDYKLLTMKLKKYLLSKLEYNLSVEDKQEIYIALTTIEHISTFNYSIDNVKKIIILNVIMRIVTSLIKFCTCKYFKTIKDLENFKKESDVHKLILMKYGILNIIIYKFVTIILLLLHKCSPHDLPKFLSNPPEEVTQFDKKILYNAYTTLKESIDMNLGNHMVSYLAGSKQYNVDNINDMILSLKSFEPTTTCDAKKAKELLKFLQDPHVQKMLLDGDINIPYKDVITNINNKTLNNKGYVPLTIFNELLNTDIGKKLMTIFSGETAEDLSTKIYKEESYINNGINFDDNSFGFKTQDIVFITVMECLDALRASSNSSKNCCAKTSNMTVNLNTPITKLSLDGKDFYVDAK